jgi:predicted enzyme related to lactoylglutathione lyase
MSSHLGSVTFDALEPRRLAAFWGEVLGREVRDGGDDAYDVLSSDEGQLGLRFVGPAEARSGPNRHHLHLTSTSEDDFQGTIDRIVALGGAHIDVGQLPDEDHVVLADPEGNELCVIAPGNNFLAGTGQVGELSCDGSRAVGVFWSEALGWPLVWDQDEETSIQSPAGGTKVSWGGPPRLPLYGARDRLRLELVAEDPEAEAERLVGLGATRVDERQFQDPDGNDFGLRPAVAAPRP